MEKRLLLAIALSFLVIGVYTAVIPKPKVAENKAVIENVTSKTTDSVLFANVPQGKLEPVVLGGKNPKLLQDKELINIDSNGMTLRFARKGAFLYEVFDKKHKTTLAIKNIGLVKEWSDYDFTSAEITRGIVFTYRNVDGLVIKKTFRIKDSNDLELSVDINDINDSKTTGYSITAGSFSPEQERDQISARYYESCAIVNGITVRKPVHGLKKAIVLDGHVLWSGLRDRYFCSVFYPQTAVNAGVIENINKDIYSLLSIPAREVNDRSERIEDIYNIYVGPQDESSLKAFGAGAEKIISYGTFDSISKVLLFFLKLGFKMTKSWGLAIIFITIFVYLLLFPLSIKSMLSMKKMQSLQPKIEELRKKLKDNPQKLNIEIMELYKAEKVNPLGGCLPMILQIPVFFALYQLLMRFISLRGANFLWIKDLAEPDRLVTFHSSLPVLGNELNILPLLMAVSMFFQQKITASQANASPEAAQQQKIMMFMMPVLFGALFYKLPAGLVLYWFVNSLLMIAFQWKISKTNA